MPSQVKVTHLPTCNLCPQDKPLAAHYDGKTVMGPWANMCEAHWAEFGVGRLGTGFGQRLILDTAK